MASEINQLPIYDDLINEKTLKMSDTWISQICSFIQTLIGYLTPFGILLPILTTAQRNLIQSPVEGQIIYNIDATPGPPRTAELQVWQVKAGVGAWRNVTTV